MLAAFDIDGTIDADPAVFLSLMQALRAAGHKVAVLTGCSSEEVTPDDVVKKQEYLQNLGVGQAYDQLVVFADPPSEEKANWLKQNKADVLFDNSKTNAKASPVLTLVPWQTKVS